MKTIDTLVKDVQALFTAPHELNADRAQRFGEQLTRQLARRFDPEVRAPSLRMSNLGTKCARKLFYDLNRPMEKHEHIDPSVSMKYMYGDILEELLLFLAEEAGHRVEGRQDVLELHGIKGHRDAVIDGVTIDVKSASSLSYLKFKDHLTHDKDDFGYIDQLLCYLEAGQKDPLVEDKNRAAFLVIDKTLGHICLDFHKREPQFNHKEFVQGRIRMLAEGKLPERYYQDEEDGKSGNRKLGVACSYCPHKTECWPGLRPVFYSGKPRFMTVVKREPVLRPKEILND